MRAMATLMQAAGPRPRPSVAEAFRQYVADTRALRASLCAVCGEAVADVRVVRLLERRETAVLARCHGREDCVVVGDEQVAAGELGKVPRWARQALR